MSGLGKAQIHSIPLSILQGPSGTDILLVTQVFNLIGSHTQVTSLSSIYTASPPIDAVRMLIQASTQNIRFTLDGSSPTASRGFRLGKNDPPVILPCFGTTPKFIEEASGASLDIQYGY